jgi:hypothetical protein
VVGYHPFCTSQRRGRTGKPLTAPKGLGLDGGRAAGPLLIVSVVADRIVIELFRGNESVVPFFDDFDFIVL